MEKKNKIFIIMMIAMVLGYLPWYNFSAVLSNIVEDFHLSSRDTGLILSAFQVGYVIVVLLTGRLSDKVGPKKVVAWATLITAVSSTLFVVLARGFFSILAMRLVTGLSAGAIYVPGMALLSNWFPKKERGKVIGGYTGALTMAYGGAYFIAAPLASRYGWEAGILATSLPVFLAAGLVFVFIDEKPERKIHTPGDREVSAKGKPLPKAENLHHRGKDHKKAINSTGIKAAPAGGYRGPILITTGYMGHMWELYAFWGWIGPFMVASALAAGYGEAQAVALGGQMAAVIILLGAPGAWIFGVVADRWGRVNTLMLASIASLTAQLFFGFLYGRSIVLIFIVGLWIGLWVVADSGIYKAGLTEMTEEKIRGTALGVQSAVGYGMTMLSPFVFGTVLEAFNKGAADPTEAVHWGVPFMMLGIGALLAPISGLLLNRSPQAKLMNEKDNR